MKKILLLSCSMLLILAQSTHSATASEQAPLQKSPQASVKQAPKTPSVKPEVATVASLSHIEKEAFLVSIADAVKPDTYGSAACISAPGDAKQALTLDVKPAGLFDVSDKDLSLHANDSNISIMLSFSEPADKAEGSIIMSNHDTEITLAKKIGADGHATANLGVKKSSKHSFVHCPDVALKDNDFINKDALNAAVMKAFDTHGKVTLSCLKTTDGKAAVTVPAVFMFHDGKIDMDGKPVLRDAKQRQTVLSYNFPPEIGNPAQKVSLFYGTQETSEALGIIRELTDDNPSHLQINVTLANNDQFRCLPRQKE